MVAGTLWALFAAVAAMINQTQLLLHFPSADSFFQFGKIRPIYTTTLLFGSALSFFYASAYYIVQKAEGITLKFDKIAGIGLILHQAAVAIALIALGAGINKGREWGEMPWISDGLIDLSLLFFISILVLSLKERESLSTPTQFILIAAAGGLITFVTGNLSLPYGPLSSAVFFNGLQDAAVQEFYRTGVLGFLILMPAFATMYYFIPAYYRVPLYSTKLATFQAVTMIILIPISGSAALAYTAAPAVLQSIGIAALLALTVSILGGVVNLNYTISKSETPLKSDTTSNLFRAALLFIAVLSILRGIGGLKIFQERFALTFWNVFDVSLDAQSYALMVMFAAAYLILQNIRGQAISNGSINLHLMLIVAGIALIVIANFFEGVFSYYSAKELTEENTFAVESWAAAIGIATDEGNPKFLGFRSVSFIGYLIVTVSVLIATMNTFSPFRTTDRPYTEPSLRA